MRRTSEAYDPFPRVRDADAVISFEVLAKTLNKRDVSASGSAARLGSPSETVNGVPEFAEKYGTLEKYGWPLDGSCALFPDGEAEAGFWPREVSREDGTFASPITLRLELPEDTDTFGWTFHFDPKGGVRASRIRAVCYDAGGNVTDESEASVDGFGDGGVSGWSYNRFVRGYRAVEFTFYGTNLPHRMLRLAEVDFGITKRFTRDTITEARIRYGMAPDGSAFPAKKIDFTFDNADGAFNVLSPAGVYQYWRNGQTLTAKLKIGGEAVDMGSFFVTRAQIGKNRLLARVTAHDACWLLANQRFYPGSLASLPSVRLDEAVAKALEGSDLAVDFGGLGAEPVSLRIRNTHDRRTVLRYLAQAARAALWIDRDGVLRIRRIVTAAEAVAEITADELYDWSGVSIAEEVAGVTLTVPRELEKDEDGEVVTEQYSAGISDDEGNAQAAYENPCVAPGRGQLVADWLLSAANRRKKYAVKNRCDPAVEIGDTIRIADAFRNDECAVVTGLEIVYDGGLYAVTEADREF